MSASTRKRRLGGPGLILWLGVATLILSAALWLVTWEMRPLTVRSKEDQRRFWRESYRIMSQTDVPSHQKSEQLVDLGFGINGWNISTPTYPYVVAMDLFFLLAGVALTGYGAVRLARERQSRLHRP